MTHKSSSILLVLVAILEFGLGPISIEAAGAATVRDVLPCPPIEAQSASGVHESVVTGTFRHTAMSTVELSFEASKGGNATTDTLVCTPQHPFWSADRHEFVAASALQPGESIQTADDSLTRLTSIVPRAGPCEVYGLEVFGEHVYFAGEQGLLVHNASGNTGKASKGTTSLSTFPKAKSFANSKLLKNHYKKHVLKGREWGDVMSEKAYVARAKKLLSGPAGKNVSEYRRFNGDVVRFNKRTGEYGIVTQDGIIRTIFRPQPNSNKGVTNGLDYFLQDRLKQIGI